MLFSVIVPIYKVEKYLRQCIESVLNQTCKDFELILVDDGSPDNCPQICDEYAMQDHRIKVIHKENGGVVQSRRIGTINSKGEYIVYIDADDYISENFCEEFSKIIEVYSPDMIVGGYSCVYDSGEVKRCLMREKQGYYDRNSIKDVFFPYLIEGKSGKYFSPSLVAKAYKKDVFYNKLISFNENIHMGEDQAVLKPCIYSANSIYILTDEMYFYRQHVESITKSKKMINLSGAKLIAEHFERNVNVSMFDFQAQIYRHAVHDLFNACVSQFNGKDGSRAAKKRIKTALQDDYYKKAIKNCKFAPFTKGWFAKIALKHELFFLMRLYHEKSALK